MRVGIYEGEATVGGTLTGIGETRNSYRILRTDLLKN
jgi:hypothetical protein